MAGKAKPKVKNGVDNKEPAISMTYIDDILLRLDKAECDVDSALSAVDETKSYLDSLDHRVNKVEVRLGLD